MTARRLLLTSAPTVEQVRREAKAEALREAADDLLTDVERLDPSEPTELAYINCTHLDAAALRHRADRIAEGES